MAEAGAPGGVPVPASADESALLADLRAKKAHAYEQLLARYGPRIRAAAMRILGNEADANDVLQETFLAALRSVDRFEGKAQVGTWLHRIAINAALMKVRSSERRPEVDLEAIERLQPRFDDAGQHPLPQPAFRQLPEEQAMREETCAIVRRCIAELPERYRIALLLRDIEGLENSEVADQLGLTLNAAKMRIHRARQALRTLLVPYFGEGRT